MPQVLETGEGQSPLRGYNYLGVSLDSVASEGEKYKRKLTVKIRGRFNCS